MRRRLPTEVSEYLREFERKSSAYLETSQVSQIRENAGKKPVTVDADLYDLISRCVELCERGGRGGGYYYPAGQFPLGF